MVCFQRIIAQWFCGDDFLQMEQLTLFVQLRLADNLCCVAPTCIKCKLRINLNLNHLEATEPLFLLQDLGYWALQSLSCVHTIRLVPRGIGCKVNGTLKRKRNLDTKNKNLRKVLNLVKITSASVRLGVRLEFSGSVRVYGSDGRNSFGLVLNRSSGRQVGLPVYQSIVYYQ